MVPILAKLDGNWNGPIKQKSELSCQMKTVKSAIVPLRVTREPLFFDCLPRWSWHSAALRNWMIWAVLRGNGQIELNESHHQLREGVVLLLRPGDLPLAEHDPHDPLLVYTVHFEPLAAVPDWRWPDLPSVHTLLDVSSFVANARVSVSAWARGDPCGMGRSNLAIWQLIMQYADEQQRRGFLEQDDRVSRILARIDESPQLRWSLSEMAESAGLSVSTLHRVFRSMTGHSPGDYVVQRRFQSARQLLETTTLPVAEIAEHLGYCDPGFFCRQFKRFQGSSPSAFRKQRRG